MKTQIAPTKVEFDGEGFKDLTMNIESLEENNRIKDEKIVELKNRISAVYVNISGVFSITSEEYKLMQETKVDIFTESQGSFIGDRKPRMQVKI